MFVYELCVLAMLASSGLSHSDKPSSNATVESHAVTSNRRSELESGGISVPVSEAENDHIPGWNDSEALRLQAVEKQVSASFEALRSRISWTKFDVSGFTDTATTIGIDISMVAEGVDTLAGHKDIMVQYNFLAQMFEIMLEAAQCIEQMESSRNPASILVRNMIELNVRLLVLYNSFGVPDYQSQGYAYKVTRLKRLLNEWKSDFAGLKNTSQVLSRLFKIYVAQATNSLKQLENHVSLQWFSS